MGTYLPAISENDRRYLLKYGRHLSTRMLLVLLFYIQKFLCNKCSLKMEKDYYISKQILAYTADTQYEDDVTLCAFVKK